MTSVSQFAAATASVAFAGLAVGQTYNFTVDPQFSNLNTSTTITAPIVGTFIGDYDPKTNPGGTLTRPGLFGGSGNQPIPYTANLIADGDSSSQPFGTFSMTLDTKGGTASIAALDIDLLNGATSLIEATLSLTFQTFRTFNPDSLFIGVSNFPLPLGDFALTTLTMQQSGDALGTLTPSGKDLYSFAVPLPAIITLAGEYNGAPIEPGPIPLVVVMAGTIELNGGGAIVTMNLAIEVDELDDSTMLPFENLPLPVPTVLPPGEIANLLMSGTVQSIHVQISISGTLSAVGQPDVEPILGDLNNDGRVDVLDLLILLGAWGGCPNTAGNDCPADLNNTGNVDVQDLLILLSNWG
ncbi:MAG TPA: dockerin type I domain-containing protein [Phycisphaerales bacterium]|nr:dockerin type I domain-containing protein [Phycisphaerales bacterium]HRQ74670.1 dockerin type I domain-containing protein [Phycisphaerales bacterium]